MTKHKHHELYKPSKKSRVAQNVLGIVAWAIAIWLLLALVYDFGGRGIPRWLVTHSWWGAFIGFLLLIVLASVGHGISQKKP